MDKEEINYNVNEYLEWCKENKFNPMSELNMQKFKKLKKPKKIKIKDLISEYLEKEISVELAEEIKPDLIELIESLEIISELKEMKE